MTCKQCGAPLPDDAPFCLSCGEKNPMKARKDEAFGDEFDEEFRYDEEVEQMPEKRPAQSPKQTNKSAKSEGKKTLKNRALMIAMLALLLAALVFAALCVTGIIRFHTTDAPTAPTAEPAEQAETEPSNGRSENDSRDPSETDAPLSDADKNAVSDLLLNMIPASAQTYDLDKLLAGAPPKARETILSILIESYNTTDETALRELFQTAAENETYVYDHFSFAYSNLLNDEAIQALENSWLSTYDTTFGPVDALCRVSVTCDITCDGTTFTDQAEYLVGRVDGAWYCVDF